jgi:predicted DNA binding CopG/RHH family protein
MSEKPTVPKFDSEAEEAEWWDQHRDETAQWVEEAVAAGKTTTLSAILNRARQDSGRPSVMVDLDADDAARARALATRKGVPLETYLKTLLHEALERDQDRR